MEENVEKLLQQKLNTFYVLPIINYPILQVEVLHSKTAVHYQYSLIFQDLVPSSLRSNKGLTFFNPI